MTLDAADLQAIGAIGGLVLANATLIVTILGGWTFWLVREGRREMERNLQDISREMERDRQETDRSIQDLRREMNGSIQDLRREMDRNRQEMNRNHREVMTLLGSHTHGTDDAPPVFHDLPDAADDC